MKFECLFIIIVIFSSPTRTFTIFASAPRNIKVRVILSPEKYLEIEVQSGPHDHFDFIVVINTSYI